VGSNSPLCQLQAFLINMYVAMCNFF
jgi:hypothetical protein